MLFRSPDGCSGGVLQEHQITAGADTCEREQQTDAAEQVQWSFEEGEQESYREHIQYPSEQTLGAVFRPAVTSRPVIDRNLGDNSTFHLAQDRDVSVHVPIEVEALGEIGIKCLESTVHVLQSGSEGPPRQYVVDS